MLNVSSSSAAELEGGSVDIMEEGERILEKWLRSDSANEVRHRACRLGGGLKRAHLDGRAIDLSISKESGGLTQRKYISREHLG